MPDTPSAAGEPLYGIPAGKPAELELAPRKTSWDSSKASSQVALRKYLDHVEQLAAGQMSG
jgi:hypothetical protein